MWVYIHMSAQWEGVFSLAFVEVRDRVLRGPEQISFQSCRDNHRVDRLGNDAYVREKSRSKDPKCISEGPGLQQDRGK